MFKEAAPCRIVDIVDIVGSGRIARNGGYIRSVSLEQDGLPNV